MPNLKCREIYIADNTEEVLNKSNQFVLDVCAILEFNTAFNMRLVLGAGVIAKVGNPCCAWIKRRLVWGG